MISDHAWKFEEYRSWFPVLTDVTDISHKEQNNANRLIFTSYTPLHTQTHLSKSWIFWYRREPKFWDSVTHTQNLFWYSGVLKLRRFAHSYSHSELITTHNCSPGYRRPWLGIRRLWTCQISHPTARFSFSTGNLMLPETEHLRREPFQWILNHVPLEIPLSMTFLSPLTGKSWRNRFHFEFLMSDKHQFIMPIGNEI